MDKGVVTNLTYSYTGNQLTGLSAGEQTGIYTYDKNGNMQTDSRRGLNIAYNFLNLVSRVTSDNQVKASYTWLSDGTKLRVADATGNGFYYLGSLIYQQNNGVLQLETADFGDGVILSTASGGQEVHYFLRDHLGSVRVIVDGMGIARERNDYFPFGKHRVVAGGSEVTNNRFKYNGKEFQTTGNLNYLDYGARMYDTELGRWFGVDPMAEEYYSLSPYHYCGNNPLLFIDPDGRMMDWFMDADGNLFYDPAMREGDEKNWEIRGVGWGLMECLAVTIICFYWKILIWSPRGITGRRRCLI